MKTEERRQHQRLNNLQKVRQSKSIFQLFNCHHAVAERKGKADVAKDICRVLKMQIVLTQLIAGAEERQ